MWMLGLKSLGYDIKVPDETNSYLLHVQQEIRAESMSMQ